MRESLIAVGYYNQSLNRSQMRPANHLRYQTQGLITHDRSLNNELMRGMK